MFHHIDPRSLVPLHAQIATRIRVAVATNELQTGDRLPSSDRLSRSLRVNPSAVLQAYTELDAAGIIEMQDESGAVVRSVSPEWRAGVRNQESRRLVHALLGSAIPIGLNKHELRATFEEASCDESPS